MSNIFGYNKTIFGFQRPGFLSYDIISPRRNHFRLQSRFLVFNTIISPRSFIFGHKKIVFGYQRPGFASDEIISPRGHIFCHNKTIFGFQRPGWKSSGPLMILFRHGKNLFGCKTGFWALIKLFQG